MQRGDDCIAGARIVSARRKAKHCENMSVWEAPQNMYAELDGVNTKDFEMETPFITCKDSTHVNW